LMLGVDVAKDNLVASDPYGKARTIANSEDAVAKLLSTLDPGATIAMEATGNYHKLLANAAFSQGFKVIVFNPRDVLHYAKSIFPRAKTDQVDAKVIARYALARPDHLPYEPTPAVAQKLLNLSRARASLVKKRTSLENELRECPELSEYLEPAIEALCKSVAKIDKELSAVAAKSSEHVLMTGIPGVGTLVGAYTLGLLMSGVFERSDSFVGFTGLDVRIRQSGKKIGRSCISKRGDPEARRLLFLAARTAANMPGPFRELYLRYQTNGLSKTAATVAVARKIARTLWAIYTKKTPYCADRVLNQTVRAHDC
jgi:transposase